MNKGTKDNPLEAWELIDVALPLWQASKFPNEYFKICEKSVEKMGTLDGLSAQMSSQEGDSVPVYVLAVDDIDNRLFHIEKFFVQNRTGCTSNYDKWREELAKYGTKFYSIDSEFEEYVKSFPTLKFIYAPVEVGAIDGSRSLNPKVYTYSPDFSVSVILSEFEYIQTICRRKINDLSGEMASNSDDHIIIVGVKFEEAL